MGRNIVEMLGGGDLGGVLIGHVQAAGLQQLDETVKLRGGQEGIHRIGENHGIGAGQQLHCRGEILFQSFDFLAGMEGQEFMVRKFPLQISNGLQGDAVFALGASVNDGYLHNIPPLLD